MKNDDLFFSSLQIPISCKEEFDIKMETIDIKVRAYLKVREYVIIERNKNIIKFTSIKPTSSYIRYTSYYRVSEGVFEFIPNSKTNIIKSHFKAPIDYEMMLPFLILFALLSVFKIQFLFGLLIMFLHETFRIIYLKWYFLDNIIYNPRHCD